MQNYLITNTLQLQSLISGWVQKRAKTSYSINSLKAFVIIIIFSSLLFPSIPLVNAASISFQFASYTLNAGTPFTPIIITVTDSAANLNSSVLDTVSITVTSTTDPSGITLILTETGINTGVFQNTNLVLTTGNAQYQITDTITVSITDSTQNVNVSAIDTISVNVFSSSDITGITLTLSETGINSGIFQGTLAFTSSPSSGNAIMVAGGDVVSINYPISGETTSGLIIPNPNPGIGSIKAAVGDSLTATYLGMNDVVTINPSAPGGGGGGPIRAGLVVNAILGLGGCSLDCFPPTLGVTRGGQRLVDNGFSYNENPINVELFYTPYPLITVETGKQNVATLKIFENTGIQNIRHVELGFGLGKDQIISESKAVIEYDINFDGSTQTKLYDPYNVLDNVTVTSQPIKCKPEEENENCMEVSFYHAFRESLEFNIVGTNVWDHRRNGWQNYFNDGVEIIGNSLNPPKQITVLDREGYPVIVTITEKNEGLDEHGNVWFLDGDIWKTDYKLPIRDDPITQHGIDRNNNKFSSYMLEQQNKAERVLDNMLAGKLIQNPDFGKNYYPQIFPTTQPEDYELQQRMLDESVKAENLFKILWSQMRNNH